MFSNMESDKNFNDLINKYQILLENEKRRLTPANFNLTEKDEKVQTIESNTKVTKLSKRMNHRKYRKLL